MTEKGFIICRPSGETTLNGLEYLLDDRNEIMHFETEEKVKDFLKENGIEDDEDIIIQYHIFCQQCAREFFFDTANVPDETEDGLYICPECKTLIKEKKNKTE